jgi:alkyl hydroperoxide reductase subunit AhpC
LCRSAFVIDKKGIVRYVEVPGDFSTELDYEQIAASLDVLLSEDRVTEAPLEESDSTRSDACPDEGDGSVDVEV